MSPIRVPARTVTRLRVRSAPTTPCMFLRLSSRPLVATTGVNEWPEPATRTGRFARAACATIAASSSSEAGSPLWRATND